MFCRVLSFILISFRRNSGFFSPLNDAFSALIFQVEAALGVPSYCSPLRQTQHCRASSHEPQVLVQPLLLSPEQLARACALTTALSSGWDSRKGTLCNNCLQSFEHPWISAQRERSWCQPPTCEHEPTQMKCFAISCCPGHELQFPAGNSAPWQPISVPRW